MAPDCQYLQENLGSGMLFALEWEVLFNVLAGVTPVRRGTWGVGQGQAAKGADQRWRGSCGDRIVELRFSEGKKGGRR